MIILFKTDMEVLNIIESLWFIANQSDSYQSILADLIIIIAHILCLKWI